MNKIGINTFGMNELLCSDFQAVMLKLKEIGFSSIEPMVVFPQAMGMKEEAMLARLKAARKDGAFWPAGLASERIVWLRENGLAVEGIHLGLLGMIPGGLGRVLPYAVRFAKENNIRYIVHSPQKKTIAEMAVEADMFREAEKQLAGTGIEILFHCHWQEFQNDHGDTPFAYLMREVSDLRTELDVGWVHFAGADTEAVLKEYGRRIAVLHFKDLTEDACSENIQNCFTAVGEGTIPLEMILKYAETMNLSYTGFIIDQDNSRNDMLEDLRIGFANLAGA